MANYWYKKDKRVLRVDDDLSTDKQKELKDNGYVQVLDRRNPENSIIKESKPKVKIKPKKKTKKK
tara:strand:+ start:1848 stop:2042 length:195 start_codon:yes stop_codon:yes gene_type:complete